jgi:hypothetical protein
MKKEKSNLNLFLATTIILFTVLSLSFSFVSASWLSDFWGKITGNAISGNAVSNSLTSASNQEIIDYISSDEEVIVPVSKEIHVFIGADIDSMFYSYFIPISSFVDYRDNGFVIEYHRQDGKKDFIERFSKIMSDPKKDIVEVFAHGLNDPPSIWLESYNLSYNLHANVSNSSKIDKKIVFESNLAKFKERVHDLEYKFGEDAIGYKIFKSGKAQIYITPYFFIEENKEQIDTPYYRYPKKSAFYLISCLNGANFVAATNSRFFIASYPDRVVYLYGAERDLEIINSKIYDSPERNFKALSDLKYPLLGGGMSSLAKFFFESLIMDIKILTCEKNKDNLCTLFVYRGQKSEESTIAISPVVKSITLDSLAILITFNAPMEQIDASEVVSVDTSQCKDFKYDVKNNVWSSNKELSLGFYAPPATGEAGEKRIKVTVHNDKAVSKYSNIRLTGNPFCCNANGCEEPECWSNPLTKLKPLDLKEEDVELLLEELDESMNESPGLKDLYKSDFVFYLPCPEKEEPNLTICQQNGGSYARKYEEYSIQGDGSCVLFAVTETFDCEGNQIGFYSQNLPVPNEVCLQRGSCVAINANEKEDVSLCLTLTTKTQCDKAEVCQWVKPGEALA